MIKQLFNYVNKKIIKKLNITNPINYQKVNEDIFTKYSKLKLNHQLFTELAKTCPTSYIILKSHDYIEAFQKEKKFPVKLLI
jgi:hypothetical protein